MKISVAFASILLVSSTVSAATFVVRPDRELVQKADAIVVGSALTSYTRTTPEGGIETVTSVSIEETIKGDVVASAIDVVEPGGVRDDRVMIIPGAPRFAEGRRVLLFLMNTGPSRWSVLDLSVGKFTFADDRLGQKLLVRDEDEVQGYDPDLKAHVETRRAAAGFLQFVRDEAQGRRSDVKYRVESSELLEPTLAPAPGHGARTQSTAAPLQPSPNVAPYSANSYTMTISGSSGSRWTVFPSAVTFFMGATQEPGAPGGGATSIQAAFASWNGEPGSNVNYVYGGTDSSHTQGLHGPDGANTVLFERDLSAWGVTPFSCSGNSYGGTLGLGGITSASGTNSVNGETFVTTREADVEMNRGIANCSGLFNSGDFNSAVTHEVGHTLGFRHSDQNRASSGSCASDPSLECSSAAIMTASVTHGLNSALQQWDIHAVQAVYPGGSSCTLPTVTAGPNTTITAGQSVRLTATTTGGVTSYQWYVGASGDTSYPVSGGTQDFMGVHPTVTSRYWVRVSNACGSAASNTVTVTVTSAPPPPPAGKVTTDLNGDGRSDLVLQNPSYSIAGWLMNGTGVSSSATLASPTGYQAVAAADTDGDGRADIIVSNPSTGAVGVYHMNSNGLSVGSLTIAATTSTDYKIITTGDFNRDGRQDIVFQHTGGNVAVWYMNGSTVTSAGALARPGDQLRLVASGDIDGDGWPDLIFHNTSTNEIEGWLIRGGALVQRAVISSVLSYWEVIAAGDVNGDGKADLILHATNGSVGVWLLNGLTATSGYIIGNPGTAWQVQGRGDFNGDGTADILLQNPSAHQVMIWLMSNGSVSASGAPIGTGTYSAILTR